MAKKLERFSKKPNDQSKDNLFETSFSDSDDNHNESNYSSYNSNDTSFNSSKNAESIEKSADDLKGLNGDSFIEKLKELNQTANSSCSCTCSCHKSTTSSLVDTATQTSKYLNSFESTQSLHNGTNGVQVDETNNNLVVKSCFEMNKPKENGYSNGITSSKDKLNASSKCDFATQTLSTGDIVITKVFFNEGVTN